MSLASQPVMPMPEETVRVAPAAFPRPSRFMQARDQLGPIYDDAAFAALYPRRGQPAEAPWRLALITVMQYADNFTDRQAADAVRSRIDWKYALALELTDSGFHGSVLSKFRAPLVAGAAEQLLLDVLLSRLQVAGLLKAGGRARTDSTHVLAAIRALNRLECVGETLRAALNDLAVVAPDWLRRQVTAEWFECYGQRVEEKDCGPCENRSRCTKAKTAPRHMTIRPERAHNALQMARQQQTTPEWKGRYDLRAGIAGTLPQGVRGFGLRQCHYVELAKTRLQHRATAAAMNNDRLAAWLDGRSHAKTRLSRFAALAT